MWCWLKSINSNPVYYKVQMFWFWNNLRLNTTNLNSYPSWLRISQDGCHAPDGLSWITIQTHCRGKVPLGSLLQRLSEIQLHRMTTRQFSKHYYFYNKHTRHGLSYKVWLICLFKYVKAMTNSQPQPFKMTPTKMITPSRSRKRFHLQSQRMPSNEKLRRISLIATERCYICSERV